MNKEKKLSQILVYADKKAHYKDICEFSTNIINSNADIRFTYLDYETNEKELLTLFECEDELIVISDRPSVARLCNNYKVAFAGYGGSESAYFDDTLYCFENIRELDYIHVERVWQRFHGIPWTIMETDRLKIREFAEGDPMILTSEGDQIDLVDYIEHQYKFYEFGLWALFDKVTGSYIGRAGVCPREGFDICDLGYEIVPEYRNRGYAKEACLSILNYMKDEFDMNLVQAFTSESNIASIHLLESLGFTQKGKCIIEEKEYEHFIRCADDFDLMQ